MTISKRFAAAAGIVLAGLTILAAAQPASAANDRWVRLHNQADESVWSLYISNAGTGVWGPDQLRDDILGAHTYIDWNVDDHSGYCHFDFKFVLKDGTVETKYNFDVCSESNLYVVSPD